MVNDIIKGIAVALDAFSGVTIYADTVEQGLNVPCFLIDSVDTGHRKRLGRIHSLRHTIQITYIGTDQDDVRTIAEQLPLQIENVTYNGHSYVGQNIRCHPDDREHAAVCLVDYYGQVMVPDSDMRMMTTLEETGGTKDE